MDKLSTSGKKKLTHDAAGVFRKDVLQRLWQIGSLRDDCRADSEIESSYKTAGNFNLEGHLETFTAFDVHALPVAFVPGICLSKS